MTANNDRMTRKQLLAICFAILLSTSIRSLLGILAEISGGAGWIVPALTIVPFAVLTVFMTRFMKKRAGGEGLGELFIRILGGAAGRALIIVYTVWLIFLGAFIILSSSERLICMIYPNANSGVFFTVLLVLCTIVALGKVQSIARLAEIFRAIMLVIIIFVLILGSTKINAKSLLPISLLDTGPVSLGVISSIGTMSVITFTAFLEGKTEVSPGRSKAFILEIALSMALITVMAAVTLGYFGTELTKKLYCPFFMLVRDITLNKTIARIDVLVVAVWMVTDFIFAGTMFAICAENTRLVFKIKKIPLIPVIISAAALALFLALAPDAFMAFGLFENAVTLVSCVLIFGVLPVVFIIGKIRRVI